MATLDTVPQEVLEHIAFFTATESFLGPPSGLVPFLLTSRSVHSRLSIQTNQHLYARICAAKFDLRPVERRLGPRSTNPSTLAAELTRRFQILNWIRNRSYCLVPDDDDDDDDNEVVLHDLISLAYHLMLENEGNNERQLCEYAHIDRWLKDYWFHERGASRAAEFLRVEDWLPETETRSKAMWLFWFLLRPGDFTKSNIQSWNALNILKTFALAAHKYELAKPAWHRFVPESRPLSTGFIQYFSVSCSLVPPPLAAPAILSFLTLVNKLAEGDFGYTTPMPPSHPSLPSQKLEWDYEWERCLSIGNDNVFQVPADPFRPGSIEGVWEGLFTYTEFTAYASLLSGGNPQIIQKSMAVRHRQTWKLREHHLLVSDASQSKSGIGHDSDSVKPLPPGDPLRSYFPTGTQIRENKSGIEVNVLGHKDVIHYRRAFSTYGGKIVSDPVQDIIITGEGHSAWGQFNLVGRVRPCDGFVSLSKEYVDGDRGKWLYRGYLVGNANANLAGRWRDTLTPTYMQGYEGCFAMSRRR